MITDEDEPLISGQAIYSNTNGYLLAPLDIKNVSVNSGVTILNDYDFTGPLNELYGEDSGSPSSTIIAPEEDPKKPDCANPNLVLNTETGLCAPLDLTECTPRLTSTFGPRWGTVHYGTDFAVPTGTKVYAIASGTVVISKYSTSAGNYIVIEHDDTSNGIKSSVYMHNSELLVGVGEHVEQGQNISKSGNTGQSSGPHLHLGVKNKDDVYVNAQKYLPPNWPN